MRETGIGTSLMLIAIGAVLAFAVNFNTTGVDLNAIGLILMLVGLIGLLFSFVALGGFMFPATRHHTDHYIDDDLTPPHEHRTVKTTDVVVEDDAGTHVERVRRT